MALGAEHFSEFAAVVSGLGLTAVSKCSNVRLRDCGYSITSSRRASWDGGTVILSAFAVFMVIASLYFVGAWTGRSSRKFGRQGCPSRPAYTPLRVRTPWALAV